MGYGGLLNYRRKTQLAIIVLLFFITIAAFPSDTWIAWMVFNVFMVMMLLTDCMFMNEDDFNFDPDFKNWARVNDPKY